MRSRNTMQALLTVVAVLLTLNLVVQVWTLTAPEQALGQTRTGVGPEREPPTPFPNQAESIRRLNETMGEIKDRLGRIEAKLDKGISVKVTEMPAVEVKNPAKAD